MIRDEFKDVKKVSSKEARKKKELGERTYLVMQIPKIKDLTHSISVSTIISTVMVVLCYIMVALAYIVTKNTEEPYSFTNFLIWTGVMVATAICNLVWFLGFRRSNLKKLARYKSELEKINSDHIKKYQQQYNQINK